MFKRVSGFVLIMTLVVAAAANAQSLSATPLKVDFSATALQAVTPAADVRASFTNETPAPKRGSSPSWVPMVLAGLGFSGGGGIAVGGGVLGKNFLSNEKYMLQIDGLYENVGGGCAFDACDVSQIAIGGMFLYKFNEMSSGWTPFAGGGIVWSQVSFDGDFICDIAGVDCSASGVGIQLSGGLDKNKIGFEFRFGGVHGGGGAILFRYRFKND